jgi:hypothetical protein
MFIHKTNSNSYISFKNTNPITFTDWYQTYDNELKNMFEIMNQNIKKEFPKYTPTNEKFTEFARFIYFKSSKNLIS